MTVVQNNNFQVHEQFKYRHFGRMAYRPMGSLQWN